MEGCPSSVVVMSTFHAGGRFFGVQQGTARSRLKRPRSAGSTSRRNPAGERYSLKVSGLTLGGGPNSVSPIFVLSSSLVRATTHILASEAVTLKLSLNRWVWWI